MPRNDLVTSVQLLRARLAATEARLATQSAELACYAEVLDATDIAVIALSLDGVITGWSPAATRLYGYDRDEVVERPVTLISPAPAFEILEAMGNVAPGTSTSYETVHLRKDGSPIQISLILARTFSHPGKPGGMVALARDVTQQRSRDVQFHHESKLESLGRLAAGLAHEINSPIQFVGDNARFLEEA
ncbi:MAG: PAS domain S-box protein, partial [Nocardioides sp.]